MTKCNSVSLTSSCGSSSCGWYDDWCCGNSCSNWNCGCSNQSCGGCANGCQSGCACVNGCHSGCGCANGCQSGCGCMNDCGCSTCASLWPDAPALPSGGVLVPRIIGTGRLCQRVSELTLCMQDIPADAKSPFALLSVTASGPSDWEFVSAQRWRALLRVTIPLVGQIHDCDGCVFIVHSSITVEVPVRLTIPTADLGRAHVAVQPGVRLLCTSGCSDDGCFTVCLAVLVDVFVARWEPSSDGVTIPCRPDLPLTLPPSFRCGNGCGCSNGCGYGNGCVCSSCGCR